MQVFPVLNRGTSEFCKKSRDLGFISLYFNVLCYVFLGDIKYFVSLKEHVKVHGRMLEELNSHITSIRIRLYQIHRELEESGKTITADRIKNIYYSNDDSKKTLLQLFSEHNTQCRQLIGTDFVAKTVQRYEATIRYLEEFMKEWHNIPDIYLSEVTPAFI